MSVNYVELYGRSIQVENGDSQEVRQRTFLPWKSCRGRIWILTAQNIRR